MTGRELAERILALPEDQQALEVYRSDCELGLLKFAGKAEETFVIFYTPVKASVDYFPDVDCEEGENKGKVLVIR